VLVLWAPTLESQIVQWRGPLIAIQALVGVSMIVAAASWLSGEERRGLKFAVSGFLLSLIAVQSLYFYLSQFQAITVTLLQFTFLLILLAYRRRYLSENVQDTLLGTVE
jgi:hypothetical protein